MTAAANELLLPRSLAVALYGAAQAEPDRILRGRVLRGPAGLELAADGAPADGEGFAAFRSRPEGSPPPDPVELERLLAAAPRVLVVSRATRGVMVLTGYRLAASGRSGAGLEALPVRIEDAERGPV